jgi:glycosyltransferase involved in cell wall biosynthesis
LELYPQQLGLPSEKLVFLYSHSTLYGKAYPVRRGDYVFSGGDSNRDYATLIAAMHGLNCRIIIVTHQPISTSGLPANLEIITGLPTVEFNRLMAGAAAVVVPLRPGTIETGGRTVYGNAMAMGKAVIVADDDAGDYITNGHDGLLVPAADPVALHQAIVRILTDSELCSHLEQNAKQTAKAFAPELFFSAIFAMADKCTTTARPQAIVSD